MTNAEIVALFDKWVKRFEGIGNGNFGVSQGFLDPSLKVYALNTFDGVLAFSSPVFSHCDNCSSATLKMSADFRSHGFQTKRKFTTSKAGYTQNYLEVFDPDDNMWIQLDATPWYQRIGTTHKESGEHPDNQVYTDDFYIYPKEGQFLATKRQPDGSFVDAYLSGNYFSMKQYSEEMIRHIELMRQGKEPGIPQNPNYQFTLWARQGSACDATETSCAVINYGIMDATQIARIGSQLAPCEWLNHPAECLEKLVEAGAARVTIEGYGDYLFNIVTKSFSRPEEMRGGHSFGYLDELHERGDTSAATLDWLEENLPVLANVVFHLGPELETKKGERLAVQQPYAREDPYGGLGGYGYTPRNELPKLDLTGIDFSSFFK